MDIEELSKSQLILLTILINFVTSVATGILTVSLLDRAPALVTQTVNRVVEHTIETVAAAVPAVAPQPAPAPSNQDLVMSAISESAARTVTLYPSDAGTTTPALSVGAYLPSSRAVVTGAQDSLPKETIIEFANGARFPASLAHSGKGLMIYGFADDATLPKEPQATLVSSGSLKLGQTALALAADGSAATGIVARVSDGSVHTTLPDIGAGSAAVNLNGDIIGVSAGGTPGVLVSTNAITELLTATTTSADAKSASPAASK